MLLNRAPTLHRLGIQAFEPQLVEGKAIQLHPLVCAAFNADFDGDQMAVHLPLSVEAQAEARILMLASNNILKPSDGRPVTLPSQDMIIGLHHLTTLKEGASAKAARSRRSPRRSSPRTRTRSTCNAKVRIRLEDDVPRRGRRCPRASSRARRRSSRPRSVARSSTRRSRRTTRTCEAVADKGKHLARSSTTSPSGTRRWRSPRALDRIKDAGFYWATRSGVTVALSDILTPPNKPQIVAGYEKQAAKVAGRVREGSHDRRSSVVRSSSRSGPRRPTRSPTAMRANFPEDNTINRMVSSGARGNWLQVRNIAGMRGLVNNPKGEIIPRPIISSYREGLSVAEYFIATHGARKGLADTALRTADSGYLTRRLVDVSQDVIIREDDCGTTKGLELPIAAHGADGTLVRDANVENSVFARTLAADAVDAKGNVVAKAGDDVGRRAHRHADRGRRRDHQGALRAHLRVGRRCLRACYGRSLATGKLVDIGEAVGIIAAQSIGEPGTQLTMRTFHTGGSASADDITQGLPRVQELFEARTPKGASPDRRGRRTHHDRGHRPQPQGHPDARTTATSRTSTRCSSARPSSSRTASTSSSASRSWSATLDPKEVLRVKGVREVQQHLVDGVQGVYRSQGVPIHDKHIEVIVRQMLRKVTVVEHGDTDLLPGELVDRSKYNEINRATLTEGKKTASARQEVMGITKASLATESWLSAASFQETTRVLTQAAMEGKSDPLLGLKENVIIGKLIPAGTGLAKYRNVTVEATEEAKASVTRTASSPTDAAFSEADLSFVDFDSFSIGRLHARHLQLTHLRVARRAPVRRGPSSFVRDAARALRRPVATRDARSFAASAPVLSAADAGKWRGCATRLAAPRSRHAGEGCRGSARRGRAPASPIYR